MRLPAAFFKLRGWKPRLHSFLFRSVSRTSDSGLELDVLGLYLTLDAQSLYHRIVGRLPGRFSLSGSRKIEPCHRTKKTGLLQANDRAVIKARRVRERTIPISQLLPSPMLGLNSFLCSFRKLIDPVPSGANRLRERHVCVHSTTSSARSATARLILPSSGSARSRGRELRKL